MIKFSDLSCVFELFVFSEILEKNRNILIEGSSVLLTVLKTISDDEKKTKKYNVYKISLLKSGGGRFGWTKSPCGYISPSVSPINNVPEYSS